MRLISGSLQLCFVFVLSCLFVLPASADWQDDSYDHGKVNVESSESFALELRFGFYQPSLDIPGTSTTSGTNFSNSFGNDKGPMLAAEFDVLPFRIPYTGLLGVAMGFGWAKYTGTAVTATGQPSGESTSLKIFPLSLMAVLRIDTLAKQFNIPFVFAGKAGMDGTIWSTSGGETTGSGMSLGPRVAGQVALQLDFLERAAARSLDADWGINHAQIFFELYHSWAGEISKNVMPLGGTGWATGLAFTF